MAAAPIGRGACSYRLDFSMTSIAPAPTNAAPFSLDFSRGFERWLAGFNGAIAFSTYQAGKVFMIGMGESGISIAERTFARCMGLAARADRMYLASLYQLWRFNNVLDRGDSYQGYDKLFIPHVGYTTGDIDAHDIGIDGNGAPVFVNTLFSCLARPSETSNFEVIWKPPFISRLAPEDRCHLNGLAMFEGAPGWVTMISRSDVAEGWRDHRHDGGVVMDTRTNELVCDGLSMPHSPRWYRGRVWFLESGYGALSWYDPTTASSGRLTQLPGFTRGLDFVEGYAVIGLSQVRETNTFEGIPITADGSERRSGVWVVDLGTGETVALLRFSDAVEEIFAVKVLPGLTFPSLLEPGHELVGVSYVLPDAALRQVAHPSSS